MTVGKKVDLLPEVGTSFLPLSESFEPSLTRSKSWSQLIPTPSVDSETSVSLKGRVDVRRMVSNLGIMNQKTGLVSFYFSTPNIAEMTDDACRTYSFEIQGRLGKMNFRLPPMARSCIPVNLMMADTELLKQFLQLSYDFDLSLALADEVPGTKSLDGVSTKEQFQAVLSFNKEVISQFLSAPDFPGISDIQRDPSSIRDPFKKWQGLGIALFCIPSEVYRSAAHSLVLNGNAIRVLHPEIQHMENLTLLSLENNQLTKISKDIRFPQQLTSLTLSLNRLDDVPEQIRDMRALEVLSLTGNRIHEIPAWIIACETLKVLNFSDNLLAHLPEGFLHLKRLECLSLSGNRFQEFPDQLFGVPFLHTLRIIQEGLCPDRLIGSRIPSLQLIVVRPDLSSSEIPRDFERNPHIKTELRRKSMPR
jgi:hypothetical protein